MKPAATSAASPWRTVPELAGARQTGQLETIAPVGSGRVARTSPLTLAGSGVVNASSEGIRRRNRLSDMEVAILQYLQWRIDPTIAAVSLLQIVLIGQPELRQALARADVVLIGLGGADLDDGDLKPTTDFRDVFGELVTKQLGVW